MTDSRRDGDGGGHREVLARRRPAASGRGVRRGGPRDRYWEARCAIAAHRLASLPSGPPSVAEAVVHRDTRCPARVARTGDPGSAAAGEDLAGERAAGDQQAREALAELDHPRRALGARGAATGRPTARRSRPRPGAQVLALGGEPVVVQQAALDQRGAAPPPTPRRSSRGWPWPPAAVNPRPVAVCVISASRPLRSACSSAAMWPSPRCSRSSVAACHRSSSGSLGPAAGRRARRRAGAPRGSARRTPRAAARPARRTPPSRWPPRPAAGSATRGRRPTGRRRPAPGEASVQARGIMWATSDGEKL